MRAPVSSRGPAARRILVTVVAGAQLAVPLWALAQPDRPARLGWQMYAGVVTQPEITIVGRDGRRQRIPAGKVLGRLRPELSYERRLARHLCLRFPNARAVAIRREKPALAVERRCS